MSVQDWLQSADVLLSLLLDSLENTDYMEDWDLCLRLLENLNLDLIDIGLSVCLNSAHVDGVSHACLTGYM
ncbi:hypothetical protein Q8A67_003053 [Cirrhinus molitorella]|uniref:Uncharacterized protein n=1 Tax=Cirrhinus molitorella TaxID=172907 RepID=A0AA88TUU3_9TELE|nr:hypothetical protein Q8A67_003053 [Cirrhinus molitorella]